MVSNKQMIKHDDISFVSDCEAGRSFHDLNMAVLVQARDGLVGKSSQARSDVVFWVSSICLSYDITIL